jgi:hypothetical protein
MWFLRRMRKIPWTEKRTNEHVWYEAKEQRKLITDF